MSKQTPADNSATTDKQNKRQRPEWVNTGTSWLGVVVFAFTAIYLQKHFGMTIFNEDFILFIIAGAGVVKVSLDWPAQLAHGFLTMRIVKGKAGAELIQAMNKAGAFGTLIKAAVVVISHVATKYAYFEFITIPAGS